MATTMTMSAACAQPLAARKSFGSKAKLGAPVKTRAARVNTVVRAARDGPVVIGLAADSGCGKSTFMRRMTSLFGGKASPPEGGNPDSNTLISDTTTVLCLDDYHLNDREGRKKSGLTALNLANGTSVRPRVTPNARDRPRRAGYAQTSTRAPRTGPEGLTRDYGIFRDASRDAPPPVVFQLRAYPRARWHSSSDRQRRQMPRGRADPSRFSLPHADLMRPGQGAQGG